MLIRAYHTPTTDRTRRRCAKFGPQYLPGCRRLAALATEQN